MALDRVRVTRFELVFSTLGKSHVGHYTKPANDTYQYTDCDRDCQGVERYHPDIRLKRKSLMKCSTIIKLGIVNRVPIWYSISDANTGGWRLMGR